MENFNLANDVDNTTVFNTFILVKIDTRNINHSLFNCGFNDDLSDDVVTVFGDQANAITLLVDEKKVIFETATIYANFNSAKQEIELSLAITFELKGDYDEVEAASLVLPKLKNAELIDLKLAVGANEEAIEVLVKAITFDTIDQLMLIEMGEPLSLINNDLLIY